MYWDCIGNRFSHTLPDVSRGSRRMVHIVLSATALRRRLFWDVGNLSRRSKLHEIETTTVLDEKVLGGIYLGV